MARAGRGRVRRGPLLTGVLAVGVVGALLIVAVGSRPGAEPSLALTVPDARVGTTYAFDGAVCLEVSQFAATVRGVEVEQAEGGSTELVAPPEGAPPVVGFPVAGPGVPAEGYRVEPGEADCTLRLLLTPEQQGQVRAGTVRVQLAYGPFGLLRRTATSRVDMVLDVTGTGADPRSADEP